MSRKRCRSGQSVNRDKQTTTKGPKAKKNNPSHFWHLWPWQEK